MITKYSILFIMLIITYHLGLAQRDSLNGASPSLGFAIAPKLSLPKDSKLRDFTNFTKSSTSNEMFLTPVFTFQASVSARVFLNQKVYTTIDIGYLNNGHEFRNINTGVNLLGEDGSVNSDEISLANTSYFSKYGFLSALIGRRFMSFNNDKVYLIGGLGVQGQYMFSSSISLEHHNQLNSEHDYSLVYSGSEILRKMLVTAVGEIGVETQLFTNVSLSFSSLFLYDLSSAKLSNNRERSYYSKGLKVGVLFDLKH